MSASSGAILEPPKGLTLPEVRREKAKRYAEENPERWVRLLFPEYLSADFAEHHRDFWRWVWSVERGKKVPAYFAIWPRGHAKSTSGELACVSLGARGKKRYVLYVCGTQEQADDHVANIAAMLESSRFGDLYPDMARPLLGKYGNSKGWRRNRLRTAGGFTVDAIGLDTAARGAKVEEDRPDVIVFDDVDSENDSEVITERKTKAITRKILPAGADKVTEMILQNLVKDDGVVSKAIKGEARFLANRRVSGPVVAVEELETEYREGRDVITGGTATWAGMDRERCQEMVDQMGLEAFEVECQNRTELRGESIFHKEWFDRYTQEETFAMWNRTQQRFVGIDTAETVTKTSAYSALVVGDVQKNYQAPIRYAARKKLEFPDLVDWVTEELAPFYYDRRLEAVFIENASSGRQLIQQLRKTGPPWLARVVRSVNPMPGPNGKEKGWKEAAYWSRRRMTPLPEEAPWLPDFESELFKLPNSTFKDQGDAYSVLVRGIETYTDGGDGGAFSSRWRALMGRGAEVA